MTTQTATAHAKLTDHDDCADHAVRSLTCVACGNLIDVRDCDLCPECGKVPSHYYYTVA